jgi:hypothetical protein
MSKCTSVLCLFLVAYSLYRYGHAGFFFSFPHLLLLMFYHFTSTKGYAPGRFSLGQKSRRIVLWRRARARRARFQADLTDRPHGSEEQHTPTPRRVTLSRDHGPAREHAQVAHLV